MVLPTMGSGGHLFRLEFALQPTGCTAVEAAIRLDGRQQGLQLGDDLGGAQSSPMGYLVLVVLYPGSVWSCCIQGQIARPSPFSVIEPNGSAAAAYWT